MAPGHDPFAPNTAPAATVPDGHDPAAIGPSGKYHLPEDVTERFLRLGASEAMMEDWRARMEEAEGDDERRAILDGLPPVTDEADALLTAAIADARAHFEAGDTEDDEEEEALERIPLPDEFAAGLLANGATAEEVRTVEDRWQDGTDEDRAGALGSIGDWTPEEWTEFVTGWRAVIAAGVLEDDADEAVLWLPPLNWNGQTSMLEGERSEVPAGHVRVEVSVDNGDDGYSLGADVPEEHKAALGFLAEVEEEGITPADRARLVLAAEMTRPASKRRQSILDAVTETLGEVEVATRTVE